MSRVGAGLAVVAAALSFSAPGAIAQFEAVYARTVDQTVAKPRVTKLSLDPSSRTVHGELALADGKSRPIADLVRLAVYFDADERGPLERMPDNAVALLTTDGEWIVGLIKSGDTRQAIVTVAGAGEVSVPLKQVRGIVTPAGRSAERNGRLLERRLLGIEPATTAPDPPAEDVLRLTNGEVVRGMVVAIEPKSLTVTGALGEVKLDLSVLAVAQLSNPLPAPAAGRTPSAWVELADGSRLWAGRVAMLGDTLRIHRAVSGDEGPLAVRARNVVAIDIRDGRWRWLDAMTPLNAEHQPFMTIRWPMRSGANVMGGPLKIGQTRYARGLGVHSASRVVYDIAGASRFRCLAGLDASAGAMADVDVQVFVDGQVRLERKGVKASADPIAIDVDVSGGKRLELRVDFGANGDVQDRFNWADAALVYDDAERGEEKPLH